MQDAPAQSTGHRHGGRVVLLDSAAKARGAEPDFLDALQRGGGLVGFDMEWRPDRGPSQSNKVALLQLAVADTVFLVRTSCLQFQLPSFVRSAIEDPSVVKLAIDFGGCDSGKLEHSFRLSLSGDPEQHGILDLSLLAKACGFQERGLKSLSGRCGYRVEKSRKISVSDWQAPKLSEGQLRYACDDAYFALLIAGKLLPEAEKRQRLTALQARALASWTGDVERVVLAALEEVDTSAQDALQASLVGELRAMLVGVDAPGLPLAKVQQLEPARWMQQAGIFTGKKLFQELKDDFAVTNLQGQDFVRARADWEREPPPPEALALPWAEDLHAALGSWAELERGRNCNGALLSEWDPKALVYRLKRVARALDGQQSGAASTAIGKLCESVGGLMRALAQLENPDAGSAPQPGQDRPPSAGPPRNGARVWRSGGQMRAGAPRRQGSEQAAGRKVFVKPSARGLQPEGLHSELSKAIGEDLEEIATGPVKSRSRGVPFAVVTLISEGAAAELLARAGASEGQPGQLILASGGAAVSLYNSRDPE